ncbi:cGMP-specific 3',5'-cyclic phosphodiesterase-like [Lampris incognitus]|uniref:cGMP-specific 3',5'-cyclic phosphodiesterase-like n=1 Tax=Lampris incognitus TaxID=2546036 RepID=UPI0024B5B6FD|nr:cGMP-specific 3',5'-cyclic phosphodiesterase-like [Lampris incognitus]
MEADRVTPRPPTGKEARQPAGREQPVVNRVGWFFSPLWTPRSTRRRRDFADGRGSQQAEAWLDDHSDFTRDYFLRRASTASGSQLETSPLQPQLPRNSSDYSDMLTTPRPRRGSSPLTSCHLHTRTKERPDPLSCNRNAPEWLDPISPDLPRCRSSHSLRSPRSPVSPCPPLSPICLSSSHARHQSLSPQPQRSSPKKAAVCGRGEGCLWMLGLLRGGLNQVGSMAELCQGALLHVGELVAAELCSLSLVKKTQGGRNSLEEVVSLTTLKNVKENNSSGQAHLELVKGIMGYVVATGSHINIRDACEDPRFHIANDQPSRFKLKSVLSMPIKNHREEVVGVAVLINKRSGGEGAVSLFTDLDEKVLSNHMGVLGMVLDNAQLYESARQEAKRSQALIEMAKMLSEKHRSFDVLLGKMAATIMPFTNAQYCTIFITKEETTDSFSRVIHMECEELGPTCQIYRREHDVNDLDLSYALRTLCTKEIVNVSDSGQESAKSLICCPVTNEKSEKVIAVCQLRNKQGKDSDELDAFNRYDERLLEDLCVYCGLALQYVQTVQITERRRASIEVTQEVLAYHITAAQEEIEALQEATIPPAESLHILEFHFSDCVLTDDLSIQATIRMFLDLNLVQDFNINYKCLCQWVLSVRRGYRNNIPYHNWSHGLSTAQCMFAMLMATDQFQSIFSRLEILALMIATLNHDLDHRGVSNSYIQRTQQPLAQLYGHSSLENHHYNLCLFILNNTGSQILNGLSKEDYKAVLSMIKRAILATDLTVYMERRSEFFSLAKRGQVCWKSEKKRDLLRSMLMTASDVCAITKPWPEQYRIANLVAKEFFAQGDKEKEQFNIKPINMMNRENSSRLPDMQVEYIDGICHPLYKALSGLFDTFSPLLDGCEKNRENWLDLAERREEENVGGKAK